MDLERTEVINSGELSIPAKTEAVLSLFNEFLKELVEFSEFSYGDMYFYTKLFQTDDIESVINDQERVRKILLESPYYKFFMDKVGELVKSSFITGKRIPLNLDLLAHMYFGEFCEECQIDVTADFSDDQRQFKKELLRYIFCENPN